MTTAIKSQPLSSSKGQRTKGASDNHYVSDDGHSQGDDAKQIEEMLQHEPNTHSRPLPMKSYNSLSTMSRKATQYVINTIFIPVPWSTNNFMPSPIRCYGGNQW
ncbi:unnamed protein product [Absidia cylindrospora]